VDECRPGVTVPTYDSQGLLHRRSHLSLLAPAAPPSETDTIFYFAGRPVATLRLAPSSSTLTYLTTDHLGTPIIATADTGTLSWQGGFEPFGENWNGASAAGVFLRFPGQWVDQVWESARLESGLYYNVWRWYWWEVGRYSSQDLLTWKSLPHPYLYALGNSLFYSDPLGLEPIHNGSGTPVPYKPETGLPGQIWLCLPGQTCNADGVYPPACNNYPIKIVNGCAGEIDTAGRLIIRCPFIDLSARSPRESLSALGQLLTGGRTNNRFHDEHDDWRRPNGKLYCGCDPARPFSSPPPNVPPLTLQ